MGFVLSLCQSVGVEEEGGTLLYCCLLQGEVEFREYADGKIRCHWERLFVNHRRLVSGIRIEQLPSLEVKHANEEGDEHVVVVITSHRVVYLGNDALWSRFMFRHHTEGRNRHSHHKCRRDSLARDITYAEE